jgi:hypothetical protein
LARFSAWHHRKGHGLVVARPAGEQRPIAWWAPDRRGWWIAVLFMIGSALFAIGSFGPTAAILGEQAMPVFFAGSIFFTSAAYLQFFEATNEGDDIEGNGRTGRLLGHRAHSIGWWAASIQLIGTVWFNVTTFAGMLDLSTRQAEALVWVPDAIGSLAFLAASGLALLEVSDGIIGWRPRTLEARIGVSNMIGSIAFGVSAVASFILPSSGDLVNVWATNAFTFIGAAMFFIGAALLIPDLPPEPERHSA